MRKQTPRLGNIVAVDSLTATIRFAYRKRVFDIPPIEYLDGTRLKAIDLELRRLGEAAMEEGETPEEGEAKLRFLRDILLEAFAIMHRNTRPVTLLDRLSWPLRGNPYTHASRQEVAELLSFFLLCRTTSRVRLLKAISPKSNRRR